MNDLCYFIDKKHDTFLEDFCSICELTDVAEAKNGDDFVTFYHGVYVTSLLHVCGYDSGTGFAKS